jgi:hypothetical protein
VYIFCVRLLAAAAARIIVVILPMGKGMLPVKAIVLEISIRVRGGDGFGLCIYEQNTFCVVIRARLVLNMFYIHICASDT